MARRCPTEVDEGKVAAVGDNESGYGGGGRRRRRGRLKRAAWAGGSGERRREGGLHKSGADGGRIY